MQFQPNNFKVRRIEGLFEELGFRCRRRWMQNIENEIRNLIAQIIEKDPSEIKPDAKFVEDLGVDSMMALEILAAIEKKYKIVIPEEKLTELSTLDAAVAITKDFLANKKE
jgi:acyl carrier protein